MAQKTNSFERFWQELKRRKTGKVIVAYSATAFILLQLADILTPALLLPDWTTRLITLIIIIGFPVAVIFSWVFDISPQGIIKTESVTESEKKGKIAKPSRKVFTIGNIVIAVLLVVVVVLAYPKMFRRDALERLRSSGERISVAVMPFRNMTNETSWNIWQDGIQDILITSLSNSEEFKVRRTESVSGIIKSKGITNYASLTPSVAGRISQKLDAEVFIYGSIKQAANTIRLYAQLIDSKTEEVFKSFKTEGLATEENIFLFTDSLSEMVKDFLVLSRMKRSTFTKPQLPLVSTNSPEAFSYYLAGVNAFAGIDFGTAIEYFQQALKVDPNFTFASILLTWSYINLGQYEKARECHLKAYVRKDQLPMNIRIKLLDQNAFMFEGPRGRIKYLEQLKNIDDQDSWTYHDLGYCYNILEQYDKAIIEFEKALDLFDQWDIKPSWVPNYTHLGFAFHQTGQYRKERKLYRKAKNDFPGNEILIYRQAVLDLSEENTDAANKNIEKYISALKKNSASEAIITARLAEIYTEAGIFDKAEANYRYALSLEPENPERINDLAYFLIDKSIDFNEGLELADTALIISPDNYNYLHTKGWGLYKYNKYQEALDLLQKSWDLRMKNAIYDHEASLHLEAAKKAVAELKNN